MSHLVRLRCSYSWEEFLMTLVILWDLKRQKIAEQRQPVKTPGRWRLLCWPPLGRELFINYEPITAGLKTTNIDDNKPIQKLC